MSNRLKVAASLAVAILAVPAMAAATGGGTKQPAPFPKEREAFASGQLVVGYQKGIDQQERASIRSTQGARLGRSLKVPGYELVILKRGTSVNRAAASFKRQPGVASAEPNWIRRAQVIPNDPRFNQTWGLHNTGQTIDGVAGVPDADIDAPEAWDFVTTRGSKSVRVAVVDTGVAYDNPDLAANIFVNPGESGTKRNNGLDDDANGYVDDWRGWDVVGRDIDHPDDSDNDPDDYESHGSHVAGTIGAVGNNAKGVAGVNWQVSIVPVRVLDGSGSGTSADVAEGFLYAGRIGARVVNASLGSSGSSSIERSAISAYPNTLFVVAAGNDGNNLDAAGNDAFPCEYTNSNVVCVAASTNTEQLASFSNYSDVSVDVAAPGNDVLSTVPKWGAPFFTEGFETQAFTGNPPRWTRFTVSGTNEWDHTDAFKNSGTWSVTDNPGVQYDNNEENGIKKTSAISLSLRRGCKLEQWLRLDTERNSAAGDRYDGLVVETSDTGQSNDWDFRAFVSVPNNDSDGIVQGTAKHDASVYDGRPFYVRYSLFTDESNTDNGVWVDDVKVYCRTATYTATVTAADELKFFNGTSMATPHAAGTAALILAKSPSISRSTLRNRLEQTGDEFSAYWASAGVTRTGRRINANKAVRSTLP
jgi:subtilisin family serine protease